MSLLEITGLRHSFGEDALFNNAALTLNRGEHIGVVGRNGAGKSTLVKLCTGQMVPDEGVVTWQPGVRTGTLDQHAWLDEAQTLGGFLRGAFAPLYATEAEMMRLYTLAAAGDENALMRAAACGEKLEAGDFYTVDTRIEQVAAGLGLLPLGLDRPLGEMSGGQRAKAILAKLLLEKPDVLLLDEPTNFLDAAHVTWLAGYLAGLENAYLVVSHDFAFLEKISTVIVDIDGGKIAKYQGTYSAFLQKKAALRQDYARQYTAQQKEIKRTEAYIQKNIAGSRSKSAQGRRKQLARLERLEAPEQKEIRPVFHFEGPPLPATQGLSVHRLAVGYSYPVLSGVDFAIKGGQKMVVTGFNGAGKSTLLKTLAGQLPALQGHFSFGPGAVPGYFAQDLAWEDGKKTPLQILTAACPALTLRQARQRLARCGVGSAHAMQAIGTLSGGEQAKVKLCLLMAQPCNFLLMDEPTNHLDQNAKEALQKALAEFDGSVLLVSHEEDFYRGWATRVIDVAGAATA